MSPETAWYVARAGGLVAWALLAAAVVAGLLLRTRTARSPAWVLDLHAWLGGLALTFSGVHVLALLADTWVDLGVVDVLVPFASPWRPVATAWGVVALHLLVAVQATALARRRLPPRLWRRVHGASLPALVLASVHAVTSGTDVGHPVVVVLSVVAAVPVVALTALRVRHLSRRRAGQAPSTRPAATASAR